MESKTFLEVICRKDSISGYEDQVKSNIINNFKKYIDEISTDKLGNIIALKKGSGKEKKPRIMLTAHMDEIGLMVTDIEDNGFLSFTNIGGIDPRTIVGQEVIVHGKRTVFGVIGSKPPHLQDKDDQDKAIKINEMTIDLGYSLNEVKEIVRVGDPISIKRDFLSLRNKRVSGKALDNRAGITSLFDCMKELSKFQHESDVYFVATVQEEVSMAGAMTAAYSINPDIGIAVDVGFGTTPELNRSNSIELGKGPGITLGGNIHPGLRNKLISIAREYNLPYQTEITPGPTGTDARAIQITREGIPALVLSIPLRYMHTSVEVVDMDDISFTGKLLSFFINSLSADNLEGLLCY